MSVFATYLRKEWRDQRSGVVAIAIGLPLLVVVAGIAAFAGHATVLDETGRQPAVASAIGVLFAALAVSGELLSGESRRRRLRFLERVPASLRGAFAAKLTFHLATIALTALYAAALACVIALLRDGALPQVAFDLRWPLAACGAALWIFAVSAWVPHGALALPAAAIAIAAVAWPIALLFGAVEFVRPATWEVWACASVVVLGALVSAYAAFVVGLRRGGSHAFAASVGLASAAIVLAPAWAWGWMRVTRAAHVDPFDRDFVIQNCWLTANGHGAIVYAERLRQSPGDSYRQGERLDIDFANGTFERVDADAPDLVVDPPAAVEHVRSDAPKALLRGADERVWSGLGWRDRTQSDDLAHAGIHDPFRERTFTLAEIAGADIHERDPSGNATRYFAGPRSWLVYSVVDNTWQRWDPESRALEPTPALAPSDQLAALMLDGTALVCRGGNVEVVDLASGVRSPVRVTGVRDDTRLRVDGIWNASPKSTPIALCAPALVRVSGSRDVLALYDHERRELVLAGGSGFRDQVVGFVDERAVIVLEDRKRIARIHFGSDERELLFPR